MEILVPKGIDFGMIRKDCRFIQLNLDHSSSIYVRGVALTETPSFCSKMKFLFVLA